MLDLRIRSEEALSSNWYFSDNTLSWLSDGSWEIKVNCEADSMCGVVLATNRVKNYARNSRFSVQRKECACSKVIVRNESGERKPVKLFFYHEFRLYSAEGGDTALL